ncbi:hypothetical protein QJQ45_014468 [Haematococcus lacustris]|nr:hypothetical protein QJQ45_014468 [Haematococcus lacustris]
MWVRLHSPLGHAVPTCATRKDPIIVLQAPAVVKRRSATSWHPDLCPRHLPGCWGTTKDLDACLDSRVLPSSCTSRPLGKDSEGGSSNSGSSSGSSGLQRGTGNRDRISGGDVQAGNDRTYGIDKLNGNSMDTGTGIRVEYGSGAGTGKDSGSEGGREPGGSSCDASRSEALLVAQPPLMGPSSDLGRYSYRVGISYDGTDYAGWQMQPDRPTIQLAMEQALARCLGGSRRQLGVSAAGRTDAGVHAAGQVGGEEWWV